MNADDHTMILRDQDDDALELTEVFGMGEPMAALFVWEHADPDTTQGVNLNRERAVKVRDWLNDFLSGNWEGDGNGR